MLRTRHKDCLRQIVWNKRLGSSAEWDGLVVVDCWSYENVDVVENERNMRVITLDDCVRCPGLTKTDVEDQLEEWLGQTVSLCSISRRSL